MEETLRKCTTCKIKKPLTFEYFVHCNSKYYKGFTYRCRICQSAMGKEIYQKNKEKIKAWTKKWAQDNPEKVKAHTLVSKAVKNGVLVREPCRDCGNPKSHAHHEDYDKPLEVIWLCQKHHRLLHYYKSTNTKEI